MTNRDPRRWRRRTRGRERRTGRIACPGRSPGKGTQPFRPTLALTIAATLLLAACSRGPSAARDAWLDLIVDGETHRVAPVSIVEVVGSDDRRLIMLGLDPSRVNIMRTLPSAGIQWRMRGQTLEGLEGRTVRLADLEDDPIAQFELADGVNLSSFAFTPDVSVTLHEVRDDYVTGTIEARGFHRFRDGEDLGAVRELVAHFRAPRD